MLLLDSCSKFARRTHYFSGRQDSRRYSLHFSYGERDGIPCDDCLEVHLMGNVAPKKRLLTTE